MNHFQRDEIISLVGNGHCQKEYILNNVKGITAKDLDGISSSGYAERQYLHRMGEGFMLSDKGQELFYKLRQEQKRDLLAKITAIGAVMAAVASIASFLLSLFSC